VAAGAADDLLGPCCPRRRGPIRCGRGSREW